MFPSFAKKLCLLSVVALSDSTVRRQQYFLAKNERRQKREIQSLRPHPNKDKKYRHPHHIASRCSPCWSLTAAGGTIGKSIVLCFFWYPGFVHTTGVSGLAPHVADVSPTCRRHRQMSPNLGRHCVSLRHRRVPDTPNLYQLQPTSTSQSKHTS